MPPNAQQRGWSPIVAWLRTAATENRLARALASRVGAKKGGGARAEKDEQVPSDAPARADGEVHSSV